MFLYNDKTKVDIKITKTELYKIIKADKIIKQESEAISLISISNILNSENLRLESSDCVKEIYIIDVHLKSKLCPYALIEAFNKTINFQVVFRVIFGNEIKYITSIKNFHENIKILKTFESDWVNRIIIDFPITNKLEKVYKEIIRNITTHNFRENENFEDYIKRLELIKKLKSEIEKQTKTMNNEKQPNIKMSLNDKIKQMKNELNELEG